MNNEVQMSERYRLGLILAGVGGFLDAYTYICRGKVFANAQTGNIVLFGIALIEKRWWNAVQYFFPIMAFIVGVFISEFVREKCKGKIFHWRQNILLLEMLTLFGVGFIPLGSYDIIANVAISFVCALQVETFRKVRGNAYASTMCTGNLRSASDLLYKFFKGKKENLYKSNLYFGIIICFIIGGMMGAELTKIYLDKAVLFALSGLLVVFFMMFKDYEERKIED
ncbi:YoaK family protein [Fusobacterium sp.]|uniref:YoaK family protein n=1 Tax=Fusobacterium sp. TaxID=68766 RepID=UPI002604BA9E|nr:YoaK family protein [Fusobacterium sp.]